MSLDVGRSNKLHTIIFFLIVLTVVLSGLLGCAPLSGVAGSSAVGDLVTDSDEPTSRKRARIRLELASGYFELGQTTVALDELKQSIVIDPNYSDAHHLKGLVYMRLGEPHLAELSLKRALEISPKDANVMQTLGWLLCQESKFEESELYFSKVLATAQYDQRAKTLRTLGLCRVKSGRLVEGSDSLQASYQLDPKNSVTVFNLASSLFQQSKFVGAQKYIRELNNSDSANPESFWLGIKVERQLNNSEGVTQLATQLIKRFPKAKEINNYHRGVFDE
jgi:type IV pilus assembly protein PilF